MKRISKSKKLSKGKKVPEVTVTMVLTHKVPVTMLCEPSPNDERFWESWDAEPDKEKWVLDQLSDRHTGDDEIEDYDVDYISANLTDWGIFYGPTDDEEVDIIVEVHE